MAVIVLWTGCEGQMGVDGSLGDDQSTVECRRIDAHDAVTASESAVGSPSVALHG